MRRGLYSATIPKAFTFFILPYCFKEGFKKAFS